MSESLDKSHGAPPLADILDELGVRFNLQGAVGIVFVDATPLQEIERRYGYLAHARALGALADIAQASCQHVLGGPEIVSGGETGRSEVALFVARPSDDASFYADGLPGLAQEIRERLIRHGNRVVYPYMRQIPRLSIGQSYVMRNPLISEVSQLREALETARRDARLDGELARRELRREFTELIVAGRVSSVYEPIVEATGYTVFGYEALVRGPSGSRFESPAELFGLGQQEDLLFELDCLCRRKAIEGARDFPAGAKLFINIRPTAIHDPSFQPDALRRTLDHCGLGPSDVVFEISEQESIENYEIFREARDAYGNLGFQFALDDTGAGYASLEAVMELAPEFIKVDRAFVAGIDEDPARQNMVRAFQAIARDMNARIIGEGLDRLEELQTLAELGIHFGQGWLFGKPAPLRAAGED